MQLFRNMRGSDTMELVISNLSKSYGDIKALDQFSLTLSPGVYGLLGPNGSGKSTLMKLISMVVEPNEGIILFDNQNIMRNKQSFFHQLGYMPQYNCLYNDFKVCEFLYYVGCLKGVNKHELVKQVDELLIKVDLFTKKNHKIHTLSGGMKQRLMFAQAFIGHPKIIILDEPTAGLDPEKRIQIRNLITEFSKDRIIIIATHIVSDIELVAKEIVLLKKGKLIKSATATQLINDIIDKTYEMELNDDIDSIKSKHQLSSMYYKDGKIYIKFIKRSDELNELAKLAYPNLEDVYLYYFEDDNEESFNI